MLARFRDILRARSALAILFFGIVSLPAAAEQASEPLSPQQCSDAISVAHQLVARNAGKISAKLRDSFLRFGKSNCDLETDWNTTGKKDEEIFSEFRLRLIAMRTPSKPASPARQTRGAKD